MNGSIDDETTSTHSLTLRSITQQGYSDIPSISLNGTVGATKPLNDLNLIAMYDPAPDGYYGKIPSTRDTSPYYTGSIDIQSNVYVSDEIILTGRTVDLNDATLSASNIELYGYASLAGGVIDLGTGSVFGSGNFASMNAVNGAEYFAVEIAAEAAAVAAAEAAAVAEQQQVRPAITRRATRAASQVVANIQPPRIQSIKIPASFKAPTPIAIAAPRAIVTVGAPAPSPRAAEGTPKAAGPASSSSAAPSPGPNGDAAPLSSPNSSGGSSSSASSSDSNSTTGSSSNSSGGDSSSSGGDSSSSGGDSKSSDDED